MMVTVYIITYNQKEYIRDCLEGVVNQKVNFEWEVVVHDDASTDGTSEIVKEYATKYPNLIVSVIEEENQYSKGGNALGEKICAYGTGKYVAMCEGDDYWIDSNKLQKQVECLETHPEYSGCAHNTIVHDCDTGEDRILFPLEKDRLITFKKFITSNGSDYDFHTSSIMVRRHIYEEHCINPPCFYQPFREVHVGDFPLKILMCLRGTGVYCYGDVMSTYRSKAKGSWSAGIGSTLAYKISQNKINAYRLLMDEVTFPRKLWVHRKIKMARTDSLVRACEEGRKEEVKKNWYYLFSCPPDVALYIIARTWFAGFYALYSRRKYAEKK